MDFSQIFENFQLMGRIRDCVPFGNGHIHETFHLINADPSQPDYLLQRINHHTFPEVGKMMENIWQITNYLKSILEKDKDSSFAALTLIPTLSDHHFYLDPNGNYWRVYLFLKDLIAYDVVGSEQNIYEGAKAFGTFLSQLSDFPLEALHTTIPDFHNVNIRLRLFQEAVEQDSKDRRDIVFEEIKFIFDHADLMSEIQDSANAEAFPVRVTHNDTKFNNVLLDKQGIGRCVIDLDTVMPGIVHYDFGDGIRTTVTQAKEDEKDLDKIQVETRRFKAFATGYLDATADLLTQEEIKYLALAGPTMSYIMGVRFLTDYLDGDIYYKTHFEGQNYNRAAAQLNLCKKLLERREDMQKIIFELVAD